jgi:hypothetical protein
MPIMPQRFVGCFLVEVLRFAKVPVVRYTGQWLGDYYGILTIPFQAEALPYVALVRALGNIRGTSLGRQP